MVLLARPVEPGPELGGALASIAALGIVCTGLAFVLWFRLLRRVGPVAAVTVTLLAPVFGVAWGALFLGEPLTPGLLVGAAAVLAGVTLITRPGGQRVPARRARSIAPGSATAKASTSAAVDV
jgi:drug/metabolite transporter (DMT)-like permease